MLLEKYGKKLEIQEKQLNKKFENFSLIDQNYSQAGQDVFVLACLNGKTNGVFLDLGCSVPYKHNNSFLLENKFNWSGVAVDIDKSLIDLWNERRSISIAEDCTKISNDKLINMLGTNHVDYLSLDLEPASITLECLKNIDFKKLEFSIITYEHDLYRFGEFFRDESRKILEENGYIRVCSDISDQNNIFEDWYYNPKYLSKKEMKPLFSDKKEWFDILFNINE